MSPCITFPVTNFPCVLIQNEKRINQLIQEKENLATEVWKLKRQLDEMKQNLTKTAANDDQASFKLDQNGYHDNHLDNYEPNNPNALQRKIGKSIHKCWISSPKCILN